MRSFITILIVAMIAQLIICCPDKWTQEIVGNTEYCVRQQTYGRGAGYAWKFGDGLNLNAARRRCESDYPDLGCEQWGAIIYPKCKEDYSNSACCICQLQVGCPSGYKLVGVNGGNLSCSKKL